MSKKDTKVEVELPEENTANETATETTVELSVEEQLTADLAQEKDKFLRLFAEFENYKRRTTKERIELFSTASQDVIKALLPCEACIEKEVDYIYLAPFRATEDIQGTPLGLNGFTAITDALKTDTPIIGVGGITTTDVTAILETGISGVGVSDVITQDFNTIKAFNQLLTASSTEEQRHSFQ